ncbi:MAG: DUF1311 domain-containing protein [Candidatus Oceanisphaera merdipullorum]|nr:DUF1311 domain-containing protein [Candidatus Oceanisphaera merdipullorum]
MNKTYTLLLLPLFTMALTPTVFAAVTTTKTQTELDQHTAVSQQKAELALDKAYLQLMTSLEAEQHAPLEKAQQAWLTFRDAQAEFRSTTFAGGSIQPLVYNEALTELTQQRTQQLDRLFQEQVGY